MESPAPIVARHTDANRAFWDEYAEGYLMGHEVNLPTDVPTWSVWGTPEHELGVLGEYEGRDVVELGCGGAQFSIALARRGARCTAIDTSTEQLALAERLLERATDADGTRPDVALVCADVEGTSLPDASFDLAFSDYGASMYADPLRWVPEAARLLRPGGRLVFSAVTPLLETCWPSDERPVGPALVHDYFDMHRTEARSTTFNLPYGEWIRLFRRSDLDIVDLVETRPPAGVLTTAYRSANQVAWARRWPAEMIWVLERRGSNA
jgi:SAM-dependent methyltransferase